MHRRTAPLAVLGLSLLAPAAPSSAAAADFPPKDSGYHNYAEMVAEIQKAETDHPDIVDVFSIGKSYQNRNIWAAKISDNVADDENEPEVLFDGLHHAREHLTVEQTLAILRWLSDGYGSNAEITGLVDTREVWIIFNVNPDGGEYDLTGSPYRAWRKNRQPNSGTTAVGTDLNRNYGYRWACCGGSSSSKSSDTYHGSKAFSAPESRVGPRLHQQPGRGRPAADQDRDHVPHRRRGGPLAVRLHAHRRPVRHDRRRPRRARRDRQADGGVERLRAKQSSSLYVTDGDEIDWAYGVHRIFMYTFEMYPSQSRSTSTARFYPPDEVITRETNRNRDAVLQIISRAGCLYSAIGKTTTHCGPFFDDFEAPTGWSTNPHGTDTATGGKWVRANPETTTYQSGSVTSGSRGLVTAYKAGAGAQSYDVDAGVTTIRSTPITLGGDGRQPDLPLLPRPRLEFVEPGFIRGVRRGRGR